MKHFLQKIYSRPEERWLNQISSPSLYWLFFNRSMETEFGWFISDLVRNHSNSLSRSLKFYHWLKNKSWWPETPMASRMILIAYCWGHLLFSPSKRHNPSWRFSLNYVNGHWVQCQESWYHQAKRAVSPKGLTILLPCVSFSSPGTSR